MASQYVALPLQLVQIVQPAGQSYLVHVDNGAGADAVNIQDGGNSITVDGTVNAVQSGIWNINNITGTVSLPTGASTLAAQNTGNASLASIDSKLTAPLSVIGPLTDAQLRASPVPVSGTVSATQGTSPWLTGRNWTLSSGTDSVAAVQSGTWNINNISGTISLPTGAATATNQTTANTSLASIDSKIIAVKQTYTVAAAWQVAATPTDVFFISGSNTKLIRVQNIKVSGTNSGDTNISVGLILRSSAYSGGSGLPLIGNTGKHDSTNNAPTAYTVLYNGNPTLGTFAGVIGSAYIFFPAISTAHPSTPYIWNFNQNAQQPVILRTSNEFLAVSLGGATIAGTTVINVEVTWTEE